MTHLGQMFGRYIVQLVVSQVQVGEVGQHASPPVSAQLLVLQHVVGQVQHLQAAQVAQDPGPE